MVRTRDFFLLLEIRFVLGFFLNQCCSFVTDNKQVKKRIPDYDKNISDKNFVLYHRLLLHV